MIFNKKIDRALWLMLESDEENKENIVRFITSMPEVLKKKILDNIKILEEYKNTGVKNFSFLCGECDIDNRLLYSFEIDPYINELEMGYMECYNGIYRDVFKMTLYLGDNLDDIANFKKNYIGEIKYNINIENIDGLFNIINFSENEYNFIKTPLGCMVVYSKDDGQNIRSHFAVINSSNMPEELCLEDIQSNITRVRRKKK